jgi:hypothetical protein
MITLAPMALRSENHRRLPARLAQRIQHVKPIE